MNEKKKRSRIELIDIAKAITIILVILGPWIHTWLEGPQLLVACIATCISFTFALLLCAVIEKFVPQLLGQFPRYPK